MTCIGDFVSDTCTVSYLKYFILCFCNFIMADKFEDLLLYFGYSFHFRTVDFP